MSTRFTCIPENWIPGKWILGFVLLISMALLVACGSKYSASSDGLIVVPSQGSAVIQSFSFNLSSGSVSQINTNPGVASTPFSVVIDPAGTYAYVASTASTTVQGSSNQISSYKINSDGTLSTAGTTPVGATPVSLTMDLGGKFLFVANGLASTVSVFSIGSGGNLTAVGTVGVPAVQGGGPANLVSLATTPTAFPAQFAPCSNNSPPSNKFLYAVDAENNVVWEFSVSSSGALVPPAPASTPLSFATGSTPAGVAIDPCNRFVYVTNQMSNDVSGYTICSGVSLPACPNADGSLVPALNSPYNAGGGPGPLVVSPFGGFAYVVNTLASNNTISQYQISPASGALTPLSQPTVTTGTSPVAIAIRSDDNWLFVTNNGSASGNGSVSQYAITPSTGALGPANTGILTDTFPWGIAVK